MSDRPASWPLSTTDGVLTLRTAGKPAGAPRRPLDDHVLWARAETLAVGDGAGAVSLCFEKAGAPARAADLSATTLDAALAELESRADTIGVLAMDGDDPLLAAALDALCGGPQAPSAVALARGAGVPPGTHDRRLFDWGYLRLRPGTAQLATDGTDFYLRSGLVSDLAWLREPSANAVSMQTLGLNGRFGNQLFQYAFLMFYALRNNCRIQTPRWIGNMLYGLKDDPCDMSFQRQAFTVFTGVERHLWTMSEPPVNLDFFGYFQEIPVSWRRHRQFLRRLFRPNPAFTELSDRWLERSVPRDVTLVGIHVRRADYAQFDHERVPWFRPIPVEWYVTLLHQLWPSLERPLLFLATDDVDAIAPHFAAYEPLIAPSRELAIPELGFLPDFQTMQRCAILAAGNSSFSRMASLLADDSQIAYLPNMQTQQFERYEPWLDEDFWVRFEA